MRYSPRESVTATMDGTCRAGLVTVTVTPGSTAALSSVTVPSMPASCWPAITEPAHTVSQRIAAAQPIVERSNHRLVILSSPSDNARDRRASHNDEADSRRVAPCPGRARHRHPGFRYFKDGLAPGCSAAWEYTRL